MTLPGVLRSGRGTPYGYVLDTPVPPIKTLPERARCVGDPLRRDHA